MRNSEIEIPMPFDQIFGTEKLILVYEDYGNINTGEFIVRINFSNDIKNVENQNMILFMGSNKDFHVMEYSLFHKKFAPIVNFTTDICGQA